MYCEERWNKFKEHLEFQIRVYNKMQDDSDNSDDVNEYMRHTGAISVLEDLKEEMAKLEKE